MANKYVCLCREVNKDTGEIAAYKIDMEVDEHALFCLSIRQRMNPELRYFVTSRESYTENGYKILEVLGRENAAEMTEFLAQLWGVAAL